MRERERERARIFRPDCVFLLHAPLCHPLAPPLGYTIFVSPTAGFPISVNWSLGWKHARTLIWLDKKKERNGKKEKKKIFVAVTPVTFELRLLRNYYFPIVVVSPSGVQHDLVCVCVCYSFNFVNVTWTFRFVEVYQKYRIRKLINDWRDETFPIILASHVNFNCRK